MKKSPFSYIKLRKRNILFIEKYYHKFKIDKGVYIDIYLVENNLDKFKTKSDVIIANRYVEELADELDKVYTRYIFRNN